MDSNEFQVGERKFKLGKIDAFRQFHIVRRIAPLLAELMPALAGIAAKSKGGSGSLTEEEKLEEFARAIQPVMEGLSKLTDADADYVLFRLLGSVEMQQPEFGGVWAKIATDQGLMIQSLDLPTMLQAAGRALMFNLTGFFALLPQK